MAKLPVVSSVLYGNDEERWAKDAGQITSEKRVLTMRDLVAPQTIDLFTIHHELVTKDKRPMSR